jgi:hypothetical protein
MPAIEYLIHISLFLAGLSIVILTLFSAVSTFVLPRAARSQLNRLVFGSLRRIFDIPLHFAGTYRQRDAIMAYYAPIGLMLLLPAWYTLISIGYSGMYWAAGSEDFLSAFRLSNSSLFTLGFAAPDSFWAAALSSSEAMLGLIMVGLLIAFLPTLYSTFSRREQAVNMLEVRAGNPPSALEMLLRFNRIHGFERLSDYWKNWEVWFADVDESHTTMPVLVFFRSPRADYSWITAAGTVLDAAALTLSSTNIPYDASAALCIRAGYLALHHIADYFDIPHPDDPHFPADPISVRREEFEGVLDELARAGAPVKADRDQAWRDFAGWRVNYDSALVSLCSLVMAPQAAWSSDRAREFRMPPLFILGKKDH